jgi:hypothetical protein
MPTAEVASVPGNVPPRAGDFWGAAREDDGGDVLRGEMRREGDAEEVAASGDDDGAEVLSFMVGF